MLDEIDMISDCLRRLHAQAPNAEIVVIDGGSTDGSPDVASSVPNIVLIRGTRGRGSQLAVGARLATGDKLVFLHVDTRLDDGWPGEVEEILARPGVSAGAFRYRIDSTQPKYRLIEKGVGLRSRLLQLPYGDQGLFMLKSLYDRVGGYREWPIMEDVDLVRRLRREGRITIARATATTSPRTWERRSTAFGVLRNWILVGLYFCGIPPSRLARHYGRRRTGTIGAS